VKRLLIDTSSYEEILLSFSEEDLTLLEKREEYAIEGFVVVRKELRDIPKKEMLAVGEGKIAKLRLALLSLYDRLTASRSYALDELMVKTAEEYFTAYVEEGGKNQFEELENDFEVVACASHKQVDLVISEDRETMRRGEALRAYEKVNSRKGLRMPLFLEVVDLRKKLRLAYRGERAEKLQNEKSGGVKLD